VVFPGTPFFTAIKTDRHDKAEIMLKVVLSIIIIDLAQSPELSPVMDFSLFTPPFASTRHVDINGYIFTYNKDVLVSIQVN
jgi:hypothetical protein